MENKRFVNGYQNNEGLARWVEKEPDNPYDIYFNQEREKEYQIERTKKGLPPETIVESLNRGNRYGK